MKGWIKCHFDTYCKMRSIVGVYVWEIEQGGKVVGYQVLVDAGRRMLVYDRCSDKAEAIRKQESLVSHLGNC
jgi:hypothetical protein